MLILLQTVNSIIANDKCIAMEVWNVNFNADEKN